MQAPLQAKNDIDAVRTDSAEKFAQTHALVYTRSEAVAQRKVVEMTNSCPRVLQQWAVSDAIHNGPRMVAQHHKMNSLFGGGRESLENGAMPAEASPAQRKEKPNNTGLPNQLKSGIESLSGVSMEHVKVHYNSDKPAQLQAHAYAQGSEIHLAAGQERHLPHEAWHIVQQAQGRVKATTNINDGVLINADAALEVEADTMGLRALADGQSKLPILSNRNQVVQQASVVQMAAIEDITEGDATLEATKGYEYKVIASIYGYTGKIRQLSESGDSVYVNLANYMAAGYKTWVDNYYNKTQAYLYEASKAGAHTDVSGRNQKNVFAMLGQDTDSEPDITIATQEFDFNNGMPVPAEISKKAVEIKASTSPNYEALDNLVLGGMKQLRKREVAGGFSSLLLEVHNDNRKNSWPFTANVVDDEYGGNLAKITREASNARLKVRMTQMAATANVTLPTEVVVEQDGIEYGRANLS